MADLPDVETALVAVAAGACGMVPALASTRVYRGWPASGALSQDLTAGIVNVTVFPVPGATRNTTRWGLVSWASPVSPTLTVSVVGNTATFSGLAAAGQLAGALVQGMPFVYAVGERDTPASVAALLAAEIRAVTPAVASGTTLTVPGVEMIVARTVCAGPATTEYGRQEQSLRLSVWAPSAELRDLAGATVASAFAPISFLTLADGSAARVRYRSTATIDDEASAGVLRRDFVYAVEYAATATVTLPSMLFGDLTFNTSPVFA